MSLLSKSASVRTDIEVVSKGGLFDFVNMAWREVEPAPFTPNWHHEEVCAHLEAMSRCEIRDLAITEPPGCTKSLLVNVLWPAWEWIKRPTTKYIYASFDPTLVGRRDGGKLINLLKSPWFKIRWGSILVDTNPSASDFDTIAGGFRFSTSPGGKGTGRHSNITVCDDPTKPVDATGGGTVTKQALHTVLDWWGNTMSSRQADPKTHRNLVVMQRLHNQDLAGMMIREGYIHLNLPMRFVSDMKCRTQWGGDRRTREGQLLFPQRFPEEEVKRLEVKMGPTVAAAQLQQTPSVEGGGVFKRSDWLFWAALPNTPEPCLCENCFRKSLVDPSFRDPAHITGRMCEVCPTAGLDLQSWDMAFKKTDDSDFVAAGVWRAYLSRYFLLDIINERMGYTLAKAALIRWSLKWPSAYDKLVEDTANGPAIIDDLRVDIAGLTPITPLGGKEARANACSPLLAAGKVFLPHPSICPLVWLLMSQAEAFPKEVNDDLVDMMSQALLRLRQHGDLFSTAMARIRGDIK